jgi:hypothetical protein
MSMASSWSPLVATSGDFFMATNTRIEYRRTERPGLKGLGRYQQRHQLVLLLNDQRQ